MANLKFNLAEKAKLRAFLCEYLHNRMPSGDPASQDLISQIVILTVKHVMEMEIDECYLSAEFLAEMLENEFGGDKNGVVAASFEP
jgi:hypothetical protein